MSELQAESHKSDQKLKEMDTLIKMMDLPEIEDLVNKVNEEIE